MPTLIKYIGDYSNIDVNENLIHYCLDSKYEKYYGGSAVLLDSTDSIIKQFKNVQNIYNKSENRPVEHFIISFNDKSSKGLTIIDYEVYLMAKAISYYIGSRFQNVFAVHRGSEKHNNFIYKLIYGPEIDPDNLHVHFTVNRVSYLDGSMFYGNNINYNEILNYARNNMHIILDAYNLKDLKWFGPFTEETYFHSFK